MSGFDLDHTGDEFAATLGLNYDELRRDPTVPPPDGERGRRHDNPHAGAPVWTWPVVARICNAKGIDPATASPVLARWGRFVMVQAQYPEEAAAIRLAVAKFKK